jgi:hypothetical protein
MPSETSLQQFGSCLLASVFSTVVLAHEVSLDPLATLILAHTQMLEV